MTTAADETPDGTLAAILHQGVRAIRMRVDELIHQGEDYTQFIALVSPGGDTPEVRTFNVRLIPREQYAAFIQKEFPDVAVQVREPIEFGNFRIVVLFDGMIAVRTLMVEEEDHSPIKTFPINTRGVGLA